MARPGISTKNAAKIAPRPKFWNPKKSVFSGYFGVNSGSPEFRAGGLFFRYFSWKFRVGPSRGSVAGGGVLKTRSPLGGGGVLGVE